MCGTDADKLFKRGLTAVVQVSERTVENAEVRISFGEPSLQLRYPT